jgi:hypothetical protein
MEVRVKHIALGFMSSCVLALGFVAACTPAEDPPPVPPPADAGPEPDPEPSCAAYCASITEKCTGGSAQFGSEQECLGFCNGGALAWPVGTADEAGAGANTLGCRQYHAGAAANDDHCIHAGPTGGGVCGTYCDTYCDAAMANCTGGDALYADASSCQAQCAVFRQNGAVNAADGNTVQCRLYHLGAAKADPATHCAHGSVSGADVCGTWCDNYCGLMATNCPGEYTNAGNCGAVCAGFPDSGDIDDATGDSVQCRIYHASAASADVENDPHCVHASEFSTAATCR